MMKVGEAMDSGSQLSSCWKSVEKGCEGQTSPCEQITASKSIKSREGRIFLRDHRTDDAIDLPSHLSIALTSPGSWNEIHDVLEGGQPFNGMRNSVSDWVLRSSNIHFTSYSSSPSAISAALPGPRQFMQRSRSGLKPRSSSVSLRSLVSVNLSLDR
jgi:hypothetical protein